MQRVSVLLPNATQTIWHSRVGAFQQQQALDPARETCAKATIGFKEDARQFGSMRRAVCLEFCIGSKPFDEGSWAIARRHPEHARCFVLLTLPQRPFAAKEI